jgi:hypothetical protein
MTLFLQKGNQEKKSFALSYSAKSGFAGTEPSPDLPLTTSHWFHPWQ